MTALTNGSMEVTPLHMPTLVAADDMLIFTTSVRYITRFDATPLYVNLSTLATTATNMNNVTITTVVTK